MTAEFRKTKTGWKWWEVFGINEHFIKSEYFKITISLPLLRFKPNISVSCQLVGNYDLQAIINMSEATV